MILSKMSAAILAALAVVSSAILIIISRHPFPAAFLGLLVILCVSFLYIKAAHGAGDGAEPQTGASDIDSVAGAIESVADGEPSNFSSLDPRLSEPLARIADRLESLSSDIIELSPSDELTSLAKENVFNNVLWREFNRSQRYGEPMSMVLLEVEGFEPYVEKHGPGEGDQLLKQVASVILQIVRETDLAARYGAERFAVIMPQTAPKGAADFAERLRNAVREGHIGADGGAGPVTVSLGVASVPDDEVKTAPDLVEKAAHALDAAKGAEEASGGS